MKNIELTVEGMSCAHCISSVEKALYTVEAKGKVNLKTKTVLVEFDESKATPESIKSAIEEQGYDVTLKEESI